MLQKSQKIKDKQASISNIDYIPRRKNQQTIDTRIGIYEFYKVLSKCNSIRLYRAGKSFTIQAYGNRAIENGYKTYYIRVPTLLEEIKIAKSNRNIYQYIKKYQRFQVLILDDLNISNEFR